MMLSIVIPVLNEDRNIPELVRRLQHVLDPAGISFEIVFVDDGSTDRTPEILHALHAEDDRIKAVHLARNFGHQAAIAAGMRAAAGDAVAVMDGDLQDSPEMIPIFLERWQAGYDVVYAIRERRAESWPKRLGYRLFYRLLARISQIDIPLDSGDFSLMSRRVVDVLNGMPERTRFVRGMRSWAGFRQIGVDHVRGPRFAGEAKYTYGRLVRLALDGFFAFSYRPLQLASLFGVAVSALALALAAGLVALKLSHGIPLVGWTSLMVAVLFMGGVQLICVGILGEYIGRIYEESRGRPPYLVARVIGKTQLGEGPRTARGHCEGRAGEAGPVLRARGDVLLAGIPERDCGARARPSPGPPSRGPEAAAADLRSRLRPRKHAPASGSTRAGVRLRLLARRPRVRAEQGSSAPALQRLHRVTLCVRLLRLCGGPRRPRAYRGRRRGVA